MSGQKSLYSCLLFLIFLIVINVLKSNIRKNRVESDTTTGTSEIEAKDENLNENKFTNLNLLIEYHNICMNFDIFTQKPEKRMLQNFKSHIFDKTIGKNSNLDGWLAYTFVIVLVALLIGSIVDIVNYMKHGDSSQSRRCSLQNYQAMIRERQKLFRETRQHSGSLFKESIEENSVVSNTTTKIAEDLTKSSNLFCARPKPLIRRQSVPIFATSSPKHIAATNLSRRTSIDAQCLELPGSAGNSSPEVKRRVRMIHRH